MRKDGESRADRKRAKQFFVKRGVFAIVEHDARRAVVERERAPQLGIFKVPPDEYARASAWQVVTSQVVALGKTRARRNAVAYAEELAVFKRYHAVVTVVVHKRADGAEYRGARYRGKAHQGGDGFLLAFELLSHIQPARDGAVKTYLVSALCPRERQPERFFGRQTRNTDMHVALYAGREFCDTRRKKNNIPPLAERDLIYGVPEESFMGVEQRRSLLCVRERLRFLR